MDEESSDEDLDFLLLWMWRLWACRACSPLALVQGVSRRALALVRENEEGPCPVPVLALRPIVVVVGSVGGILS